MTVEEQSAISPYNSKHRDDKKYDKICEVTGIDDRNLINCAIKACTDANGDYEIHTVIDYLLQSDPLPPQEKVSGSTQTPPSPRMMTGTTASQGVGSKEETTGFIGPKNKPGSGVIDLTADTDQELLQKAIAESLRDNQGILGGQVVSQEDQEISRVLEQSLQENKVGTKRKRGDIWFVDPLNPHERKRVDRWPVGLKNVGNTCWFSAVIQSLFHLYVFRKLVLQFVSSTDETEKNTDGDNVESSTRRNRRFMHELRRLFALMVDSKRKYVDPSKAVEILKEGFVNASGTSAGDSQQDVSEFQHKLLEWLEDAFRTEQSTSSTPEHGASAASNEADQVPANPMGRLFYGQSLTEGVNEGQHFRTKQTFGQFPLQVAGFHDIHESLEAATAQGEIEAVSSHVTQKSDQEQWFTRLPPVLTFELSRFQFNQALGRPEKIHNKLEFPQIIHMDRYLEANKTITRHKREEVKKIKEELKQLEAKLDRFINYGSGPKRFPLLDVLQYALQFAHSKRDDGSGGHSDDAANDLPQIKVTESSDVEMASPRSQTSMQVDSPPLQGIPDVAMGTPPSQSSQCPSPSPSPPGPRHVSPQELEVLQGCLRRWRTEVEADVKALQISISSLQKSIDTMYSEPGLQKWPYKLHAVLVHEGQAASGHYWAYVFSHTRRKWLKYNDITVSDTTWAELCQDSFGGFQNASAYCLMYVDASPSATTLHATHDGAESEKASLLPPDLRKYVNEDNARFEKEIMDWDTEQQAKATEQQAGTSKRSPFYTAASSSSLPSPPASPSLPYVHAKLCLKDTQGLINRISRMQTSGEPENNLREACKEEAQRLFNLSKNLEHTMPQQDPRMHHLLVYMFANAHDFDTVCKRIMMEHVQVAAKHEQAACGDSRLLVYELASRELQTILNQMSEEDRQVYQRWHADFNKYRETLQLFVVGMTKFHKECYSDGLLYLLHACEENATLTQHDTQPMKGVHSKLLNYYTKQCLLHVTDEALQYFEAPDGVGVGGGGGEELGGSGDGGEGTLQHLMTALVLPGAAMFGDADDDIAHIKNKFCQLLSQDDLTADKMDKLQDYLSRLFEIPAVVKLPPAPPSPASSSSAQPGGDFLLERDYAAALDAAHRLGILDQIGAATATTATATSTTSSSSSS